MYGWGGLEVEEIGEFNVRNWESSISWRTEGNPTLGTLDAVDEVRGGEHEPLSHLEGLQKSLDGGDGRGMGPGVTSPVVVGES